MRTNQSCQVVRMRRLRDPLGNKTVERLVAISLVYELHLLDPLR